MRFGRSGRGWRPRGHALLVALAVLAPTFMWHGGPASPAAADGEESPDWRCTAFAERPFRLWHGGTTCRFSHGSTGRCDKEYFCEGSRGIPWQGPGMDCTLVGTGCGWDAYTELTAVGDITRDGVGDVVAVRRSDGCLGRWRGDATGGLDYAGDVGCGWDSYAELTGVGDITRDGIGDLVGVRSADGCIARWRGNGNGGFEYFGDYGCVWKAYTNLT